MTIWIVSLFSLRGDVKVSMLVLTEIANTIPSASLTSDEGDCILQGLLCPLMVLLLGSATEMKCLSIFIRNTLAYHYGKSFSCHVLFC